MLPTELNPTLLYINGVVGRSAMNGKDDLVDRLRAEGDSRLRRDLSMGMWKLCSDAANKIEQQAAEIKRLKADIEFEHAARYAGEVDVEHVRETLISVTPK